MYLLLAVAGLAYTCHTPGIFVTDDATGRLGASLARVLPAADVGIPVTVCVSTLPELEYRAGQVWSERDGHRALLIHMGPALRDMMPDYELDAIIGHELAHEVARLDCVTGPDRVDCELAVDFLATRWVGYDATISAMRTYMSKASPQVYANFERRIRGLEELRKLSPLREPAVVAAGLAPDGQSSWRETGVLDETLTEVAAAVALDAGLPHKVVVLTQPSWRRRGIVNATTNFLRDTHAIIRVSPILVEELNAGEMRGLLAHELAHSRAGCGPKFRTDAEAQACEHKADALSARWVGRTIALRTLCHVMAISFEWRYTTDASAAIERIRLLHHRTDIPRETPAH